MIKKCEMLSGINLSQPDFLCYREFMMVLRFQRLRIVVMSASNQALQQSVEYCQILQRVFIFFTASSKKNRTSLHMSSSEKPQLF